MADKTIPEGVTRIDGAQIEYMLLVEKGMEPQYPSEAAEKLGSLQVEHKNLSEKYENLQKEYTELEEKFNNVVKEKEELSTKLEEIQLREKEREEAKLSELRHEVAVAKVKANLMAEDKIGAYEDSLKGVSAEHLSVMLSDFESIKTENNGSIPAGTGTNEAVLKEEELREQLFGHKEPADKYYSGGE